MAGAALGVADLAAVDARLALERWRSEARIGEGEWRAADERLAFARRFAPTDAAVEADSAELLSWWVLGATAEPEARGSALERAREHQLRALAARPTWGQAWARLAEIEFLDGRPAGRIAGLLEMAMALAPWEPGVQLAVNRVGLALWDELPGATRESVRLNIVRAASIDGDFDALAEAALHHGRLEWLAVLLADLPARAHAVEALQHRARR